MAKALIEIIGNAESYAASIGQSIKSTSLFKTELNSLNVDVTRSAEVQVKASMLRIGRMREEMAAVKALAASYARGSDEQIAAMDLVARKQRQLAYLTGASYGGRGGRGLSSEERRSSGLLRGGLHGAGIGGLGLSALAGGAFFGSYLAASSVRTVIDAATKSAAIEKQLAAQYRASGLALSDYRRQIDETLTHESALSGFNKDDLTQSYMAIFRSAGSTSQALRDTAIAADLARGRGMGLQAASLLIAKVLNGNIGLLKRYGIATYQGETATQALAAISQKYADQARAGTTAQERFSAELHNSEVVIGTALLPTVTHLLSEGTRWLDQMNRTGALQRDVTKAVKDGTVAVHDASAVLRTLWTILGDVNKVTGSWKNTLELLLAIKLASKLEGWVTDIQSVRSQSALAATEAGTLRTRLASLASLGAIVVTVDIVERLIPSNVTSKGAAILKSEGGGILTHLGPLSPAAEAGAYTGRQVRDAIANAFGLGGGSTAKALVPSQYAGSGAMAEAYLEGLRGQAPSYSFSASNAPMLLQAYIAGRNAGGKPIVTTAKGTTGHPGVGKPSAITTFALPTNIQNDLARALTPAEDKQAAQTALDYTQKLLDSHRFVGLALTNALKARRKFYDEIARDSKKLAGGTSGSLLSAGDQIGVATGQAGAAAKSLSGLRAYEATLQHALDDLKAQNDVGAARLKQVKEEATLTDKIASVRRQITAMDTKASKAADTALAKKILGIHGAVATSPIQSLQATERKDLNETLSKFVGNTIDEITKRRTGKVSKNVGHGRISKLTATSTSGQTAAQLAEITSATAKLTLGQLVDLTKTELGDHMSKATLDSIEKINKVLALKFLPPEILSVVRNRLAAIKSTLQAGIAGISQTATGYKGVDAYQFAAGIPGLSRAQRVALEQRYSQIEAHGGIATGGAALGLTIAKPGDTHVHLHNPTFNGVNDIDKLINQIEKRSRHKTQRGGNRR